MPLFPSVSTGERLASVFAKFNTGVEKPLLQLHHNLMRNEDSPLSVGERELIAAYVSGIANCQYCTNIHGLVAEHFGVQEGLLVSLLEDIDSADINEDFKAILKYVKKVTIDPTKLIQTDVDDVLEAGWSERALYDALMVCCTWNFMNRLVGGLGLELSPDQYKDSADMLKGGYDTVIKKLGLK